MGRALNNISMHCDEEAVRCATDTLLICPALCLRIPPNPFHWVNSNLQTHCASRICQLVLRNNSTFILNIHHRPKNENYSIHKQTNLHSKWNTRLFIMFVFHQVPRKFNLQSSKRYEQNVIVSTRKFFFYNHMPNLISVHIHFCLMCANLIHLLREGESENKQSLMRQRNSLEGLLWDEWYIFPVLFLPHHLIPSPCNPSTFPEPLYH